MNSIKLTVFTVFTIIASVQAQDRTNPLLKSGPMLGYAEMKEAVVWVQTAKPASIHATYTNLTNTTDLVRSTDTLKTLRENAFSAHLYFRNLEPGQTYKYSVYINGQKVEKPYPFQFTTQPNWQYRTDPPAFSMALGSCVYINEEPYDRPGKPYGGDYHIFESIAKKKPNAMIWLGDNTYLRPADWTTKSGYMHRYTHTRSIPELQELLASCNNFAIWDDHEFGPNDATGSWIHKDWALDVFKTFWANPSYGTQDLPGIMTAFSYMDAEFIMLDNRYNRTSDYKHGDKHIFGDKQVEYLIGMLKQSRAAFKFVVNGGQFLNTAQVYENHANYEDEKSYILKRIEEENIRGVIFLSGDRHHSEVMKHDFNENNSMYEFTVSPLTSGAANDVRETNANRIDGSLIQERNFAVMSFSGEFRKRVLSIKYYNSKGEELYNYTISQN